MNSMREARVSGRSFNLKGFVGATMSFLMEVSVKELSENDVHSAIAPVDHDYRSNEVDGEASNREFERELLEGQGLFFPFSTTHIYGHAIMCADGRYYWLMDPWEGDEEAEFYLNVGVPDDDTEDDEADDIEVSAVGYVEHFPMGEMDYVGFLVRVEGDEVVIRSAIALVPAGDTLRPIISVREDCHIFDQPMAEFLISFMAQGSERSLGYTPAHSSGIPLPAARFGSGRDFWLN